MTVRYIFLLLVFITGISNACYNDGVKKLVGNDRGKVIQVFNSDRISSGSSILFYYLNADDEHPDLKVSYVPDRCHPKINLVFDSFSYNGETANIESVFWGKGKYKENLFIIVSWVYNLDGISTVGKYYSVFSYDYNKISMVRNNKLTDLFGSGQDGFVDGRIVKYKFKTAGDVWSYLRNR
ncbi:Uncharacterised protein [Serratia rubidaea]|uniref:Uncharacterized protein n=1 Tax=Serratia rubidaea TaxID=61652 RepID=A0A3S4I480_SERRU|nr:Uncharacterised protein [Serratia rubidaea]